MRDIKLCRLTAGRATELRGEASDLERPVQTLIENHLEALRGLRFLATMQGPLAILLTSLEDHLLSLGDDVQRKELKLHIAFKKLKNFGTVVLQRSRLLLYRHLDADKVSPPSGIGRDMRDQGHGAPSTWKSRGPVRPIWTSPSHSVGKSSAAHLRPARRDYRDFVETAPDRRPPFCRRDAVPHRPRRPEG